jgi:putative tributyrin esterase
MIGIPIMWSFRVVLLPLLLLPSACNRQQSTIRVDRPRLTPKVVMQDVHFYSNALEREMAYRVIMPAHLPPNRKLSVVYLLHGGGGGFRDFSNYSDVAQFAERDLLLVMPEGDDSYYTNSAERPKDRFEDYIAADLIQDVQKRFPVGTERENRAIIGVSMGGFGALKIALKHPDLFDFAAGLSPAVDVPTRKFSIKRPMQWRHHRSIFGPFGGKIEQSNDVFLLARSAEVAAVPYLFLTCGDKEGLLPPNREFATLLAQRHFRHEFHVVPGGHDWNQWNQSLPAVFYSMTRQTSLTR